MKNIQLVQDIQQDIIDLKAISNYQNHELSQRQIIKQLTGIIQNLEEHLEDFIKNIY